jgi:hypothetical protein
VFTIDSDTTGDNEFRNRFSGTEIVFLLLSSVSHGSATGSDVTGGAVGGYEHTKENTYIRCVIIV